MSSGKPHRLKPISLHPLSVKKALSAFMAVDPKKVKRRLKREGVIKPKNK